jgi:hypothetical protein
MTRTMLVLVVALAGCGGADPRSGDAGTPMDASSGDAGESLDGSGEDAGEADGGWGPCSVSGVPGTCLDVADCEGVSTPGFCPGPASIQCCTSPFDAGAADAAITGDAGSCDPTAMPSPNEGLVEEPGEDGCPSGMLGVGGAFCVDRFEAALVEILPDGTERAWSPYFSPGSTRVRAVSLRGAVPQGYVSGTIAARACGEAGKRLCTDDEWLRACQGGAGSTYPYGATRMDGVCNDARAQHPAIEYFGTSAEWIWSELDHPCLNQLPDGLATTGEHEGCVSEDGALDMMGNLHEWTADPAGTFRGGFYVDTRINGNGCLYRTTAHDVGHWDYSTGFRCCADLP